MGNNVRYNDIDYDVEKLMLFKGEGVLVDVAATEVIDCDGVVTTDDPRLKHRVVVSTAGRFVTLLKPEKETPQSKAKVTILSKFILKKVAAGPYVEPRPTFQEDSRPPPRWNGSNNNQRNDMGNRSYSQGYAPNNTFGRNNNGTRNGY